MQQTDGVTAYISVPKLLVIAILVQFALPTILPTGGDHMNSSHRPGQLGWLQPNSKGGLL